VGQRTIEVRELLSASLDALRSAVDVGGGRSCGLWFPWCFSRPNDAIEEMIYKEEQDPLFPMALDTLSEQEWFKRLPRKPWRSASASTTRPTPGAPAEAADPAGVLLDDRVQLPSGQLHARPSSRQSLTAIPFDLTFVDKEDRVRFFTQGRERIFARSRAILGRQVQLCHPTEECAHRGADPGLTFDQEGKNGHRSGSNSRDGSCISSTWPFGDKEGNYLGCLEVSQDLTEKTGSSKGSSDCSNT
jgi:uncharacterized protein